MLLLLPPQLPWPAGRSRGLPLLPRLLLHLMLSAAVLVPRRTHGSLVLPRALYMLRAVRRPRPRPRPQCSRVRRVEPSSRRLRALPWSLHGLLLLLLLLVWGLWLWGRRGRPLVGVPTRALGPALSGCRTATTAAAPNRSTSTRTTACSTVRWGHARAGRTRRQICSGVRLRHALLLQRAAGG